MRRQQATRRIAPAEVKSHNSSSDCWVIIGGSVYDVTTWLQDHPGGSGVILALGGQDATQEFEDVGHTQYAVALLDKYLVGVVDSNVVVDATGSGAGGSATPFQGTKVGSLVGSKASRKAAAGTTSKPLTVAAAIIAILLLVCVVAYRRAAAPSAPDAIVPART